MGNQERILGLTTARDYRSEALSTDPATVRHRLERVLNGVLRGHHAANQIEETLDGGASRQGGGPEVQPAPPRPIGTILTELEGAAEGLAKRLEQIAVVL